jgi:hypothetical protein
MSEQDRDYAQCTTDELEALLKSSSEDSVLEDIAAELAKRYKTKYQMTADSVTTEKTRKKAKESGAAQAPYAAPRPKKGLLGRLFSMFGALFRRKSEAG